MKTIHGARWWKFDFHAHTPMSKDTPWHSLIGTADELSPSAWLEKYMEAGIDCVAVTDHNSGKWVNVLKEAYDRLRAEKPSGFRELHIFPGVELSVNGGVHVLALFDTAATQSTIDQLIGGVEYRGTDGDSDGCTRKSLIGVVEDISKAGGLVIPAHVDRDKGLLLTEDDGRTSKLDALTLEQLLRSTGLTAMEVVDPNAQRPALWEQINPGWAEVRGSDCHSFRPEPEFSHAFTWVKMETPSMEELKLALLDGNELSIKRSDSLPIGCDPNTVEHNYIESLEIREARAMGRGDPARFYFSPWMNALVGGRGTGKSTAVHFIRASLDKGRELDTFLESSLPRKTYAEFMSTAKGRKGSGGLQDCTETRLVLSHEDRRFRVSWKVRGGYLVEEERDGGWHRSASQDLSRFKVRIHSQGQIIEMSTGGAKSLLDLVDERIGAKGILDEMADAENRFLTARAKWRELQQRLSGRDSATAELEDVKHKLKRFEESDHAEVLREHRLRKFQLREIEKHREAVGKFIQRIKELAESQVLPPVPDDLFGESDQSASLSTKELAAAVEQAKIGLHALTTELDKAVELHKAGTDAGLLGEEARKTAGAYLALVQLLEEEGVSDPNQYDSLVKRRQSLDEQLKKLDAISIESATVQSSSVTVLSELRQLRSELTRKRSEFLERILKDNQHVRIAAEFLGPSDVESAFEELCNILGWEGQAFLDELWVRSEEGDESGVLADIYRGLPEGESAFTELDRRLHSLKERLFKNGLGLSTDFKKTMRNSLERVFNDRPEVLDRLWLWFPDDTLSVEYSQSGDGKNFKPISSGSPGQRSAALLAFILSYGEDPIILDQPEDDLDNYLIYDLIVKQIRERKTGRQVIVVTHNPNIVVNGDAEQVLAMGYAGGQCWISNVGGLQNQSIRREVCRVMEGGVEAFERRYRRLTEGGRND